jgi:hypothetical protein
MEPHELLYFVDDIYGHDQQLDAALRRGYPCSRVRSAAPKRTPGSLRAGLLDAAAAS